MKIKTIFTFAVVCALGILAVSPAAAKEAKKESNQSKLDNLTNQETTVQGPKSGKKAVVLYFSPVKSLTWGQLTCSGIKKINLNAVNKILDSNKIPDQCKQFDVMNYLIGENDNANLKKVFDLGYNPRIYKTVNEKKQELLSQAVLIKNKEAFDMLYSKIETNGLDVYKDNSEVEDIEDILINDLFATVSNVSQKCKDDCSELKVLRQFAQTKDFQDFHKEVQINSLISAIHDYMDKPIKSKTK